MSLYKYQVCHSCAHYRNNTTSYPCDICDYCSPVDYITGGFPSHWKAKKYILNQYEGDPTTPYQPQINPMKLAVKNVVFNYPATIVFWNDGTKTVVKCAEQDAYDVEKGLSMAISKKVFGKDFHRVFKENCKSVNEDQETALGLNEWCKKVEESFTLVSKFFSKKGENKNET